jgi:hypothetical protein
MLAFLPKTFIMPIFREIEEDRAGKKPFFAMLDVKWAIWKNNKKYLLSFPLKNFYDFVITDTSGLHYKQKSPGRLVPMQN